MTKLESKLFHLSESTKLEFSIKEEDKDKSLEDIITEEVQPQSDVTIIIHGKRVVASRLKEDYINFRELLNDKIDWLEKIKGPKKFDINMSDEDYISERLNENIKENERKIILKDIVEPLKSNINEIENIFNEIVEDPIIFYAFGEECFSLDIEKRNSPIFYINFNSVNKYSVKELLKHYDSDCINFLEKVFKDINQKSLNEEDVINSWNPIIDIIKDQDGLRVDRIRYSYLRKFNYEDTDYGVAYQNIEIDKNAIILGNIPNEEECHGLLTKVSTFGL